MFQDKAVSTPSPDAHFQKRLYRLPTWRLEGRVGAKKGQEGWNANLYWDHETEQDRLRLSGPFSQGTVSIVMQGNGVYINEGNGSATKLDDPAAWLGQRLGFAVPLSSLRYWVLGLPDPGFPYTQQLDAAGILVSFEQQGWVLAFERFEPVGDLNLPKKMSVQHGDVILKVIADEWFTKQ